MKVIKILTISTLIFGAAPAYSMLGHNMIKRLQEAAKRADAGDKYAFVETVGKSISKVTKNVAPAQQAEVSYKAWQSVVTNESLIGNIVATALSAELKRPEHHLTAAQQAQLIQQFRKTQKAATAKLKKMLKHHLF